MLRKVKVMTVLLAAAMPLGAGVAYAAEDVNPMGSSKIVAIDVLLIPDERMSTYARDVNRRLRESDPRGFTLDASHVPHLSLLHRYVRYDDLPRIFAAVERVVARHPLVGQELIATGLEHSPWQDREVTSISIEGTAQLTATQGELVATLQPYSVESAGGGDAFVRTPGEPAIGDQTIDYVKTFVPKRTGERFKPHITVGISDAASADQVKAQPATPMRFKVAAVALYQLGDVGTARKELWRHSKP